MVKDTRTTGRICMKGKVWPQVCRTSSRSDIEITSPRPQGREVPRVATNIHRVPSCSAESRSSENESRRVIVKLTSTGGLKKEFFNFPRAYNFTCSYVYRRSLRDPKETCRTTIKMPLIPIESKLISASFTLRGSLVISSVAYSLSRQWKLYAWK